MRGFRSTFILLAVLAALLGYIYYAMKPGTPPAEDQKTRVFTAPADTIDEIEITARSGETTTIKRDGAVWNLTAPIRTGADDTEVSGLTTNLATLDIQRVVEEQATDLAPYGLEPPHVVVGFKALGDKEFSRLHLGDKTPTGGDMYARRPGDRKVFLVSSYLENTFNRTTFDLRDKSILAFDRDKVDRVNVVAAGTTLAFVKAGDRWRIVQPSVRAETLAVDGLVGRLKTGAMRAVVAAEPTPDELKSFGFDAPTIVASVTTGSSTATLTVGGAVPAAETYYARDAARTMVFTVDKSLVDDLRKQAGDYRPKDVFEFRSFMAARFEATHDGVTVRFAIETDKDGKGVWKAVAPTKAADQTKVEAALSALSGLQVASYVDGAGPAPGETTALTFTVVFGDQKQEERVVFSRSGADVLARRAGEPGAARVEAAKFDEALAAIDALR